MSAPLWPKSRAPVRRHTLYCCYRYLNLTATTRVVKWTCWCPRGCRTTHLTLQRKQQLDTNWLYAQFHSSHAQHLLLSVRRRRPLDYATARNFLNDKRFGTHISSQSFEIMQFASSALALNPSANLWPRLLLSLLAGSVVGVTYQTSIRAILSTQL